VVSEQAPAAEATRGTGSAGFCLVLISTRTRFLLGEPVILAVALRNCSQQERSVTDLLAPEHGLLAVRVRRPGETSEILYQPVVRRDARGKRPKALAPGEQITAFVSLYVHRDGWLLDRPGEYRVTAEYPTGEARVASDTLSLEVLSPESEETRRAASFLMSREAALFLLMEGGEHLEAGRRGLESLARDDAVTPLAAYARLALGLSLTHDAFDPATKSVRPADCAHAVEYLTWAAGRLEDAVFAGKATAALSRCLRKLGREQDAEAAVRAFFESHPQARQVPGLAAQIEEMSRLRE